MKVDCLFVSGGDLDFIDGDKEIGVFGFETNAKGEREIVIVFTNPKVIECIGGDQVRGVVTNVE